MAEDRLKNMIDLLIDKPYDDRLHSEINTEIDNMRNKVKRLTEEIGMYRDVIEKISDALRFHRKEQ